MASAKLHTLLDTALSRYHIEYHGYLANHVSQGLIALYKLGAKEDELQNFYDQYTQKLEPAIPSKKRINDMNFTQYIGRRIHFLDYVDFFKEKFAQKGRDEAINKYIDVLIPGECGSAFHAMIQLGYGLDVKNDQTVAEGMAYMAFSNQVFLDPRFNQNPSGVSSTLPSILTLLKQLRENPQLNLLCSDPSFQHRTLQKKLPDICAILNGQSGPRFGDFVTPGGLDFPLGLTDEEMARAINQLVLAHILAFHQSGARDFFLLHGISATRSAKLILPILKRRETKNHFLRSLWRALLEVYICQGMPLIEAPPREEEEQQQEEGGGEEERKRRWERLVRMAKVSKEEHIIKLVYMLKDEERRYLSEQHEEEKRIFPRGLFLRNAERMMERIGRDGERFIFDGAGYLDGGGRGVSSNL